MQYLHVSVTAGTHCILFPLIHLVQKLGMFEICQTDTWNLNVLMLVINDWDPFFALWFQAYSA